MTELIGIKSFVKVQVQRVCYRNVVCVGWGHVWVGGMCGLGVRPMFFLRANKYVVNGADKYAHRVVLGAVLLMR